MRKILLGVFLCFGVVIFSGCSMITPINYINTRISSVFITVSYKEDDLAKMGLNTEGEKEFKKEMENLSQKYLNQLTLKFRSAIDDLEEEGLLTSNERILYKNHLGLYTGWEENIFIMELRFHTATASRIFIKYCGDMKTEVDNKLLTTVVTEEVTGLLETSSGSATSHYNNGLKTMLGSKGIDIENKFEGVSVEYILLSSNRRLHSNGVTLDSADGVMHCFVDDTEGNVFTFHRVEANRHVWYLLSLTISMIFVAGTLVVLYFKKGKEIAKTKILK